MGQWERSSKMGRFGFVSRVKIQTEEEEFAFSKAIRRSSTFLSKNLTKSGWFNGTSTTQC
jgi:hypothetical protein